MGLLTGLKQRALGGLLAAGVKRLAEGKFGAGPAKVYWWLAGKKTWTALGLLVIATGLWTATQLGLCAPCYDYSLGIVKLAGVLAAIGLFDGAVRIEPPGRPPQ